MNAMIKEITRTTNPRVVFLYGLIGLVATSLLLKFTTIYMAIASVSYALMLTGVVHRRNRALHIAFVGSAMFMDVALVLILEISRAAVQTAVSLKLNGFQQAHIYCSLVAVLLYYPVFRYGRLRLREEASPKQAVVHFKIAVAVLVFRTLGFIFMFSLLSKRG